METCIPQWLQLYISGRIRPTTNKVETRPNLCQKEYPTIHLRLENRSLFSPYGPLAGTNEIHTKWCTPHGQRPLDLATRYDWRPENNWENYPMQDKTARGYDWTKKHKHRLHNEQPTTAVGNLQRGNKKDSQKSKQKGIPQDDNENLQPWERPSLCNSPPWP